MPIDLRVVDNGVKDSIVKTENKNNLRKQNDLQSLAVSGKFF